jgi:hypothetical protein
MSKDFEKKETKSKRSKVVLITVLVVLIYGLYLFFPHVRRLKPFKQVELKIFVKIISNCEDKITEEYSIDGELYLSEEEQDRLIEECVAERNKNGRMQFVYDEHRF